jgi:hypothetical protein
MRLWVAAKTLAAGIFLVAAGMCPLQRTNKPLYLRCPSMDTS